MDGLDEFLARIQRPATSESISRMQLEDFSLESVQLICSERASIRICQIPGTGEVASFAIVNRGSPNIVPPDQNLDRSYWVQFQGHALHNAKLAIAEKSRPSGKASHILMRTSLYFFPRTVMPGLTLLRNANEQGVLDLRLPTGEHVCFDMRSKEIIGGALRETAPMDTNPDRFSRHFPRISYRGNGVMVRVDQRGGTPEQAVVWGVRKTAMGSFERKSCRIPPPLLWEQTSGWFSFLYQTDEALYTKIRHLCGWKNVTLPEKIPERHGTCEALLPATGDDATALLE